MSRGDFDDEQDDFGPDDGDDVVARGMEAFQSAATEMISAARAMLDAAEELVQDPKAVGAVLGALTSVAKGAARFAPGPDRGTGASGRDDDDDGGVRRIPVS